VLECGPEQFRPWWRLQETRRRTFFERRLIGLASPAQNSKQCNWTVIGIYHFVRTNLAIDALIAGNNDQGTLRAILANQFGQLLNDFVGESVGQNSNVVITLADARPRFFQRLGGVDGKAAIAQYGCAVEGKLADASIHEDTVAAGLAPRRLATLRPFLRQTAPVLFRAGMEGESNARENITRDASRTRHGEDGAEGGKQYNETRRIEPTLFCITFLLWATLALCPLAYVAVNQGAITFLSKFCGWLESSKRGDLGGAACAAVNSCSEAILE
jgi:hypothetical protein